MRTGVGAWGCLVLVSMAAGGAVAAAETPREAAEKFFADARAKDVAAVKGQLFAIEGADAGRSDEVLRMVEAGLFVDTAVEIAELREEAGCAVGVAVFRRSGRRPDPNLVFLVRDGGADGGRWKVIGPDPGIARATNLSDAQRKAFESLTQWAHQRMARRREAGLDRPDAQEMARMRRAGELVLAAGRGDLEAVKKLLADGANAGAPGAAGDSPLRAAALAGHADVVRLLVRSGADVNEPGEESVLSFVIKHGKPEVAALLIELGAAANPPPNIGSPGYETPLSLAAWRGMGDVVKRLLAEGAKTDVDAKLETTLLNFAAASGDGRTWDLIKPLYPDLTVKDRHGYTALHWVARGSPFDGGKDRGRIARELLAAGVDPHASAGEGPSFDPRADTALLVAAGQTTAGEVVTVLLENVKHDRAQLDKALRAAAAAHGPAEVVERLLRAGASAEPPADGGPAPLVSAAGRSEQKVALLLDAGAKVNARSGPHGRAALHEAAARGTAAAAELLLARGADASSKDGHGETPLAIARRRVERGREWTRDQRYMPEHPDAPDAGRQIVEMLEAAGGKRP